MKDRRPDLLALIADGFTKRGPTRPGNFDAPVEICSPLEPELLDLGDAGFFRSVEDSTSSFPHFLQWEAALRLLAKMKLQKVFDSGLFLLGVSLSLSRILGYVRFS